MVRLQKIIAEAGLASRRAAEQIILEGRVAVNGKVVRTLGAKVDPVADKVSVDGAIIRSKRKLYIALNKPPGYLCTRSDPFERRTVADLIPIEWRHLSTVGRLDSDSEGLIFLTNDGDFSLRLTHPRYGVRKTYHVTIEGRAEQAAMDRMVAGVDDDGDLLKAVSCRALSANNTRSLLEIVLTEGKNREVRRLCASQKLTVLRLQRIRIGRIKLGELPLGKWRTLTETEIKSLLAPV